jgi:hypothetical protein
LNNLGNIYLARGLYASNEELKFVGRSNLKLREKDSLLINARLYCGIQPDVNRSGLVKRY